MSAQDFESLLELLVQWEEQRQQGRTLTPEELCPGDERLQGLLRERLAKRQRMQAAFALPDETQSDTLPRPSSLASPDGYELGNLIGRGGMGVVYQARQKTLGRQVALKMVLSGANASTEERGRFRTEAESVARLQHPNIVQIYEIGEQAGCPFLALEFVSGGNLAQFIDGKPVAPRRATQILLELARAVQHAHEHGIIHRDLKPANVLLTDTGVAKIADFGLAKRMDADRSHTQTGAVLGSPSYMAPEQAEGKVRSIGVATDVYALGAILYEMLTGRPPFVGSSFLDTLEQVRFHDPAPPQTLQPKVPIDLAIICLKCLEKDPTRRYASAADLAADLERFTQGEPIAARSASLFDQLKSLVRHSHVDANFGAWSTLTLSIAPVPIIAHVAVFLFFRHRPEYPIVALGTSIATVILALYMIFVAKRVAMGVIPITQRRQVLSTWLAHGIGFLIIPITVVRMVNPQKVEEWFLIYAMWLIQVGSTFFTLAPSAGFLYVTGSACFTLALLVPWIPEYTPLVVGCLMTANMTTQGLFLRSLAKEQ